MKNTGDVLNTVFILFLLYVLGAKCLYVFDLVPSLIAVVFCVLVVLTGLEIYKKKVSICRLIEMFEKKLDTISYKSIILIICLTSLATKMLMISTLQIASITNHFDISVYVTNAIELAKYGVIREHAAYSYAFSHLFWFGTFLTPVVKYIGDSQRVLSIFISIISTISLLLIVDIIAFRFSKVKAFEIGIIFSLLPGQMLITQYITHEHALLFFVSIMSWIDFRIIPEQNSILKKGALFAIASISLFFGYLMNASGLVVFIALGMILIGEASLHRSSKALLHAFAKLLFIFVVFVVGSQLTNNIQTKLTELPENYRKINKIYWTLYEGSNAETKGGYSQVDAQIFVSYPDGFNDDEIEKYELELLTNRYKELLNNPLALVKLIKDKSVSAWACFYYPILFTNETIPDDSLQRFYNRYLDRPLVLWEYIVTLIALLWGIVLSIDMVKKYRFSSFYLFVELYLMGTTAMLMITECHCKYTLAIQPFYWIICITIPHTDVLSTG